MRTEFPGPNAASLRLAEGETLHVALPHLRSRHFGLPLIPPAPFGSPFVRLYHGRYWLARVRAPLEGCMVHLVGHEPTGGFASVEVAAGERWFIDVGRLAGFSLGPDGTLMTLFGRLCSPTMWLLEHPLPCVFTGPATVVVYGRHLRWVEPKGLSRSGVRSPESGAAPAATGHDESAAQPATPQAAPAVDADLDPDVVLEEDYRPEQLIALSARVPFRASPLTNDGSLLGAIHNACTGEVRWTVQHPARLLVEDLSRPQRRRSRLVLYLLLHLLAWALIAYLLYG